MPTPKQLPSGAWRVQLRANGGVISVTRDNPDVAASDALAIRAGMREKEVTPKDRIKLTDAITEYIDNRRGVLSPSTVAGYKEIQRNRMKTLMKKSVYDINEEELQKAISSEAELCSYKTIKNAMGLILAVMSGYRTLNIKKLRYPQRLKEEHKFLDTTQIVNLISACHGDVAEIPILLAVWLGMRRSEIIGLRWESVDFIGKKIFVNHSIVINEEKKYVEKKQMKNTSSRRELSCPDYILSKLEAYQPDEARRTGIIFNIHPATIYNRLKKICDRNNIDFVGVHGLRHTNASVMMSLGVIDKVAMRRGGWATENTMKSIYQHVFSDDKQSADDTINAYFEAMIAEKTAKVSHETSHDG